MRGDVWRIGFWGAILAGLFALAWLGGSVTVKPDFTLLLQQPSITHPFGTDGMGQDMLARSLQGLSLSLKIGALAAGASVGIALALALISGLGPWWDQAVGLLTDTALALPHLLLLILLAFAFGGGTFAVILALALSHWPRLSRILRYERAEIAASAYVEVAYALGQSRWAVLRGHILPHLWPQAALGFVLMFPHAILHEAALSFLGFGLDPSQPAIGLLLAEAMRHMMAGAWWLAVFPGLLLLAVVLILELGSTRLGALLRSDRC